MKWIHSPSAKFEGTKALLIQGATNTYKICSSYVCCTNRKKTTDIYGVPLKEMIVPKGNENIRPGYAMNPKYITIHETDNYSVGQMLETMRYIYITKQRERKIVQRRGILQ